MALKKKQYLKDRLYKSFLSSALIPILVIEVTLLLMYFGVNQIILSESEQILEDSNVSELVNVVQLEASLLDQKLSQVHDFSLILQKQHQTLFTSMDNCTLPNGEPYFAKHENGVTYKNIDNGGSSVYLSSSTPLSDNIYQKMRCTESMDPLFKHLLQINPLITQVYFNSWDDMNRLYPRMSNAPETYGPVLNMEGYNFYYEADLAHNPSRLPVWTKAYLDPAGQGWMVSNIVPIYSNGDFLEGVTGIDITVDSLINRLLKQNIAGENNVLLLDKDGDILAMSKNIEVFLGLKELTYHDYESNIEETILKPDKYNIFSLGDILNIQEVKDKFVSQDKLFTTFIKENNYIVSQNTIPETGWRLVMLLNENLLHSPIVSLMEKSKTIGKIAIISMIIFYILFFFSISWRSHKLSLLISDPLNNLKQMSRKLQSRDNIDTLAPCRIIEIDDLNNNFNTLKMELAARTKELVKSQLSERIAQREKALIEKISATDHLTGLNNRRKIEDLLKKELERAGRTGKGPGVIIVDLDYFKKINDTFGHNVGDDCLIQVAQVLKSRLRTTDSIGRWGGEEFLVLCPETTAQGLMSLAEGLRNSLWDINLTNGTPVTASFGCSVYFAEDSYQELISRADKALYQAKENGRNRCELFDVSSDPVVMFYGNKA